MTMNTMVQILISVSSGLLGGVVVAIVNQIFTRRRTAAETNKLEAEAEKIRVETRKLLAEMERIASTVQEVSYKLSQSRETTLYGGTNQSDGADFSGQGERFFGESSDKPKGMGLLRVEQGVLNIQRTNTGGRFRITLLKYFYGNAVRDYIPKNDLIAGKRLLKLTCDAKAVGGVHTAVFVIKKKQGGDWLAKHEQTFTQNEWVPVEAYLRIPPNEECYLIIDDQGISQPGSSLQLRKLTLAEREP